MKDSQIISVAVILGLLLAATLLSSGGQIFGKTYILKEPTTSKYFIERKGWATSRYLTEYGCWTRSTWKALAFPAEREAKEYWKKYNSPKFERTELK